MIEFRAGRLPAVRTKPRLKLRPHLRAATSPPVSVDWYSRVTGWPMYANDQVGCCTEAAAGHEIQNASTYGDGTTVTITDDDVLTAYARVSGYDPDDSSTDRGAILQDVYADWRKAGVGGHKILAFAEVEISDLTEVRHAVNTFGAVGLGIVVTRQMMDDVNAGRPWTRAGWQPLGGHAVPVVGYDTHYAYVATWGRLQPMSWEVFRQVTEEGWVAILPEWLNDTSGLDPLGVDLHGLGEELASLTGGDNPFPGPVDPTPPPPTDDPDQVLAVAMTTWLSAKHL